LGQHFLQNERTLAHIAKQVEWKGKTVVEIGAGHGELTRHLAQSAKKVVAIEKDARLCEHLRRNLSSFKNVQIVFGDALEQDFSKYKHFAGNLPYEISSPLLFKVLATKFEEALFLLQKEFALRLVATPDSDDWSRLSVMTQARADISILGILPPELFSPPPEVDSALVLFKRREKPVELNAQLIAFLFQHKNQTARNALEHSAKALGVSKQEARALAEKLPHSGKKVRELSLEELDEMSRAFSQSR
jgi:16S rRNA (adenine1518-N6/adenine1519-N6)-dimethyltransferase